MGSSLRLTFFQAAAREQACHLVALLPLPNRRQSLVAHRRVVALWVLLQLRLCHHCPSYLQVLVAKWILVEIRLLRG
jgi:hypothetical protein